VSSVSVNPGELVTVVYQLTNTEATAHRRAGHPSYAPQVANRYFRKLECFCFKQQALQPNEVREFPVVFVIDPKLPTDVSVITLSYTFFEVPGQSLKPSDAAATPGAGTPAGTPARGT
jgi:cytochrome c oxidase assembly protein subunit 11